MRIHLRLGVVLAALLVAAVAFGCNGDDDDGDDGQPTAAATDVTNGENGDGDDDGEASGDDPRELAGRFADQQVKITYGYSSSADGSSGTMTLYWNPPDQWRVDFSAEGEGEGTLISSGGTTYICAEDGGEGSCFESPGAGAAPLPFIDFFTNPEGLEGLIDTSFGGVDLDTSSREIAGRDASCFSASSGEGTGEICFSDDGLLLAITGDDALGGFSLEATEVEESVSDADFEPPYPILDLGDIPGQ